MKKTILIAAIALITSSCSYMNQINLSDTRLNFKIVEVCANHALILVEPDNDYTLYLADFMEADKLDRLMESMSEDEFQKRCIAEVKEHYMLWKETWTGRTDKYLADEFEHEYLMAPNQRYHFGLKPLTRYYIYGFCVNPDTSEPLGPVQKAVFSTTEVTPATEEVEFNFMINDTEGDFFYYVRPSTKGRISFDTYFSTILKDSAYKNEPYCGDIRKYLKDWLKDMEGVIEYFIKVDISRYRSALRLEEGEDYTIVATPYNDLGNGPLTLLHFKYKKGMNTGYRHDRVVKDSLHIL